jgi:N-acetyl-anhydromuramyl-L-alanine amidase AmpD
MNIVKRIFPDNEIHAVATDKRFIVLHHTVSSNAASPINWWLSDHGTNKCAAHYVIDKDGTIYQCVEEQYWAVTLFIHKPGEAPELLAAEKAGITIEIVNEGQLMQKVVGTQVKMFWLDGNAEYKDAYVNVPLWRGSKFYASYTRAQFDAVAQLCADICHRWNIPAIVDQSWNVNQNFKVFRGVCSHHNFRADKSDVSPAFPLEKLQQFLSNQKG